VRFLADERDLVVIKSGLYRLASLGPVGCGTLLFVALFLACCVSLPLANYLHGADGISASIAAAVVCWGGTALALVVTALLQRRLGVGLAALAGMSARLTLPLVVAVVWQVEGGRLTEAGAVYYLIAFYQIALLIETAWFAVRISTVSK
jgi:hypothetical protein